MFLPFSATHDIMHTSYSVKNEKHEKIVESTSTRKNVKNEIFFIFQKMISTAEITSQDATQTFFLHKTMFRWLYKNFMAPYENSLKTIFSSFIYFFCPWEKKNHQLFLPRARAPGWGSYSSGRGGRRWIVSAIDERRSLSGRFFALQIGLKWMTPNSYNVLSNTGL